MNPKLKSISATLFSRNRRGPLISLQSRLGCGALLACLIAAASAQAAPQVATPSFSPAAGLYSSAQSVAITSATSGASVAYTADGTVPTESGGMVTHGTLYSTPLTIRATTTLSAIAFKAGYADSAVAIDGYTLQPAVPAATDPHPASPALDGGNSLAITDSLAPTLNVLYNFSTSASGGINPAAALVQGSDGNFYGTTEAGGTAGDGTIFKMTPAGVVTTMVSFTGANGALPSSALIQGRDGNFYGTTVDGGSGNAGTVFVMTPAGVLTAPVSFIGPNGRFPYARLLQGSDGNFYGTTESGGAANNGTVFTMTSAGVLTTLVSFNGDNGSNPFASLIQGSDGNFYGTTYNGGGSDGTVFKMTSTGILTTLVSFNSNLLPSAINGGLPAAALVQGGDGNFYGTTQFGGGDNIGTIFKTTSTGVLTSLVSFNGDNGGLNSSGSVPSAEGALLVQGSDGNFYGTTEFGGTSNKGTVFQMSPAGTLATLVSFNGTNGANPEAGLVQGSDGNFYGTTKFGGSADDGVIFQLIVPPQVAAPVFSPTAGNYPSAQTVRITSTTIGASIRYTTDGSTPTETNGTLYTAPVVIGATTTLKAVAYLSGLSDSSVTTGVYRIGPGRSSGGGAPSQWFLAFLALAGLLRWKLRKGQSLRPRLDNSRG